MPDGPVPDRPGPGPDRDVVRRTLAAGGVTGPGDLSARLADAGLHRDPDEVRAHLRALGAVRGAGPDGPVLAVPVDRAGTPVGPTAGPAGPVASLGGDADPDRTLQLTVVLVAAAFLVVGLLGWLIA